MRLSYHSTSTVESPCRCPLRAVGDPESALENEERHHIKRWPLSSSFRYRALRLRKDGVLRLCDRCLLSGRRCSDSRRCRNLRNWKAFRRRQWAVEQ
jgi:hypothetical protein